MSNPKEKPTLSGTRIKTRKRDEKLKEKRDPTGFRDAILQGISETEDLEQVSKFLDSAGSKVDYRRYGETLFDILFAGGILAPDESHKVMTELLIPQIHAETDCRAASQLTEDNFLTGSPSAVERSTEPHHGGKFSTTEEEYSAMKGEFSTMEGGGWC